jgi:hypothetical protein
MKCCICGKEIEGYGNNPDGAAWLNPDGSVERPKFSEGERCCDDCNWKFVIPGRVNSAKELKYE